MRKYEPTVTHLTPAMGTYVSSEVKVIQSTDLPWAFRPNTRRWSQCGVSFIEVRFYIYPAYDVQGTRYIRIHRYICLFFVARDTSRP